MRALRFLPVLASVTLLSCLAPGDEGEPYDDELDAGMEENSDAPVVHGVEQGLQTSLCGNVAGLQANAGSPMRGGCPTHSAQSSLYGPATLPAQPNWARDTLWDVRSAPAVAADGTIYFGSDDSYFYAINPTNGTEKWKVFLWNQIKSSPAIAANGTIYVGSNANKIHAISPTTHAEIAAFDTFDDVTASPVIGGDGTVYIGSKTGKFYALNASLGKKWEFTTGGAIRTSAAVGPDGTIYFSSDDNKLYALTSTGAAKFPAKTLGVTNTESSPAVANGKVYVASNANKLHAFDAVTGNLLWERTLGSGSSYVGSPAVDANGVIYIGGGDFKLHAFTPDGDELWAFPTLGAILAAPAIDRGGNIYFGSDDDSLYSVDAGGNLRWKYTTWNNVEGHPVIGANGAILVGSDDNKLHSVGAAGPAPKAVGQTCALDADCAQGLICGDGNGARYGLAATARACWEPSCQNGVKDQGETKVDCGGPCGTCNAICVSPCVLGEQVAPPAIASLNFEAGTFVRGSLATFTKEDGTIERATAHQLRYLSSPGKKRIALFEGERTNTVIRSEELNKIPGWFVPDFLVGAPIQLQVDVGTAPDGTTSADKLLAPNGGIPATIQLAANPNGAGTLSAFVKNAGSNAGKTRLILFDPIVSNLYANADAWDLPTQWKRFDKDSQAAAIPLYLAASHVQNYPAGFGDLIPSLPAADYFLWGVQWESGSFPSSYLPTNDQYRKRNPDRLTYPAAQVPAWMRSGVWQFDVMPEYSSAELQNGEQFVLFSFGGAANTVSLSKTGGTGHLILKAGGVVAFDGSFSWQRGQVITVTVDTAAGLAHLKGREFDAWTTPHAFSFGSGDLRVGGILAGATEAFAGLTEPRQVTAPAVVCQPDPSCTLCGDGQVSAGETCDPGTNPRCAGDCLAESGLTLCDTADGCVCPPGTSLPVQRNGGAFGASASRFVCVPTALCPAQCGSIDGVCGLCPACVPHCEGATCGSPGDGCGGSCPVCQGGQTPPDEEGCAPGYVLGDGNGWRFLGGAKDERSVCWPRICEFPDERRIPCGQPTDPCGVCDPEVLTQSFNGILDKKRTAPACAAGMVSNSVGACLPVVDAKLTTLASPDAVGALSGAFSVELNGSATYSVPVNVPPGRGGLAPELALTYRSSSGNSLVGFDWSISGLSAISVCQPTVVQDKTLSSPASVMVPFCLDGRRLIPKSYDATLNRTEWRVEFDPAVRVFSDGDQDARHGLPTGDIAPQSWTVETGDGRKSEYGLDDLSRLDRNSFGVLPVEGSYGHIGARAWAISRITDRAGNRINFQYADNGTNQAAKPAWIGYNPVTVNGNGDDATSEIVFTYDAPQQNGFEVLPRPDVFFGAQYREGIHRVDRLAKIEVRSFGRVLRSYVISIKTSGNGLTLVDHITECAGPGDGHCTSPTKFTYAPSDRTTFKLTDPSVPAPSDGKHQQVGLDWNSDGFDDLAVFDGNRWDVFLGSSSGLAMAATSSFSAKPLRATKNAAGFLTQPVFVLDFEQDGQQDVILESVDTQNKAALVRVSAFHSPQVLYVPWPSGMPAKNGQFVAFDANGDSLDDFLYCTGDSRKWLLFRNAGGSLSSPVEIANTKGFCDDAVVMPTQWGNETVLWTERRDGDIMQLDSGMFTAAFYAHPTPPADGLDPDPAIDLVGLSDVNGDGLGDVIRASEVQEGSDDWGKTLFKIYAGTGGTPYYYGVGRRLTGNLGEKVYAAATSVRTMDFDRDGKQDLLLATTDFDRTKTTWDFYKESRVPSGPTWPVTYGEDLKGFQTVVINSPYAAPEFIDVNGDGAADLLADGRLYWGQQPNANLLTGITISSHASDVPDGLEINYTTGIGSGVYQPGGSGNGCDDRLTTTAMCMRRLPHPVVANWTRRSFKQAAADPQIVRSSGEVYTYEDSRYDRLGRGWLGFGKRTVYRFGFDGVQSSTVEEHYDLSRVSQGDQDTGVVPYFAQLPLTQGQRWGALERLDYYYYPYVFRPSLVRETTSALGDETTRGGLITRVQETSYEYELIPTDYDAVPYTALRRSEAKLFEGDALVDQEVSTYTHDSYGNVKTWVRSFPLEPNDAMETRFNSFAHESDPSRIDRWQVALPAEEAFVATQGPEDVPLVAIKNLEYDSQGLVSVVFLNKDDALRAAGSKTTFGRDPWNNIGSATVEPLEGPAELKVTSVQFDSLGILPTAVTNPAGHVDHYDFSFADGRLVKHTDSNSLVSEWQYDGFGRLVARSSAGISETFRYSAAAYSESEVLSVNAVTSILISTVAGGLSLEETTFVSQDGDVVGQKSPGFQGTVVLQEFTYDGLGRRTQASRPHLSGDRTQGSQSYDYDAWGRLVKTRAADSTETKYFYASSATTSYDPSTIQMSPRARWITTTETPKHERLIRQLDADGQVLVMHDAGGQAVSTFEYGIGGFVTGIVDPDGNRTVRVPDLQGRLRELHDPDTGDHSFDYKWSGELKSHIQNGEENAFDYDSIGRLLVRTNRDGEARWTWDHDELRGVTRVGALLRTTSPSGSAEELSYDHPYGALTSIKRTFKNPRGDVELAVGLEYDAFLRPEFIQYPGALRIKNEYDGAFLSQVRNANVSAEVFWKLEAAYQGYLPSRVALGTSNMRQFTTYEPSTGRVSGLQTTAPGQQDLVSQTMGYDPNGRTEWLHDIPHVAENKFVYDDLGRLKSVRRRFGSASDPDLAHFDYSPSGRILSKSDVGTYVYDPSNGHPHAVDSVVGPDGTTSYFYDSFGRLERRTGPAIPSGEQKLAYDGTGLIKTIESNVEGLREYSYGASGDKMMVISKPSAESPASSVALFLGKWFEQRQAAEQGPWTEISRIFAAGTAIAEVITVNGAERKVRYLHRDHLNSVVAVSDGDGGNREVRSFGFFGENESVEEAVETLGYTGHQHEPDTSLIDMVGRLYDSYIGRFVTPDPGIPNPESTQSYDRYAYVFNDPLTLIDPSGFVPDMPPSQPPSNCDTDCQVPPQGGVGIGGRSREARESHVNHAKRILKEIFTLGFADTDTDKSIAPKNKGADPGRIEGSSGPTPTKLFSLGSVPWPLGTLNAPKETPWHGWAKEFLRKIDETESRIRNRGFVETLDVPKLALLVIGEFFVGLAADATPEQVLIAIASQGRAVGAGGVGGPLAAMAPRFRYPAARGPQAPSPIRNIPANAQIRVLKPDPNGGAQYGVEYKWIDQQGQTVRFRVHGPDGTAPSGSNAASGVTFRVQVGGRYMDAEGNLYPRGVHNPQSPNYDPAAANATHIPWPGE
ncbi:MAG: PQQ-binding-like beta-propeller repeat protein [Myxococcales bacterium]